MCRLGVQNRVTGNAPTHDPFDPAAQALFPNPAPEITSDNTVEARASIFRPSSEQYRLIQGAGRANKVGAFGADRSHAEALDAAHLALGLCSPRHTPLRPPGHPSPSQEGGCLQKNLNPRFAPERFKSPIMRLVMRLNDTQATGDPGSGHAHATRWISAPEDKEPIGRPESSLRVQSGSCFVVENVPIIMRRMYISRQTTSQ